MFIIYIQLHNKIIQIPYVKKRYSILETLENNKIIINFQCREGYCGICRTVLIYGNVKYTKQPLAYIKNFEILICCCFPTNNVYIKL